MKTVIANLSVTLVLTALTLIPGYALSAQQGPMDIFSGHFSRQGNNSSPSKTTKNNIYIKIYQKNRIATLYIPLPYALSVSPGMIDKIFAKAHEQITTNSYTRSTFDMLKETAILHMESYWPVKDQLQFECGGMSPCAVRFGENYLELIKNGMINEHIIKFNHIVSGS